MNGKTKDVKENYFFFTLPIEFVKSEDDNFNTYFIAEIDDHVIEVFVLMATSKDVKIPDQQTRLEVLVKSEFSNC